MRLLIDFRGRATLVAIAFAATLAGCSADSFRRSDRVTPWSGDALAANTAIQTISPWPRYAFERSSPTLGVRAENGMRRYDSPSVKKNAAPSKSGTTGASGALPTSSE